MTLEEAESLTKLFNERITAKSESLDLLILHLNDRFLEQRWSQVITHRGRELHVEERTQKPPQPTPDRTWVSCPECGAYICPKCEENEDVCTC